MPPVTLLSLYGRTPAVPSLAGATLVLIDCQNDYLKGPLALPEVVPAVANAARVLATARDAGTRIFHIVQKGSAGGLFDRTKWGGAVIDELAPRAGEMVIEKPRPNSFSGTNLEAAIGKQGADLIFMGFMTHMCVSTTVRAALDLGFRSTVVADACATRDLPSAGGVIPARSLHEAELAALADRFAGVFTAAKILATA